MNEDDDYDPRLPEYLHQMVRTAIQEDVRHYRATEVVLLASATLTALTQLDHLLYYRRDEISPVDVERLVGQFLVLLRRQNLPKEILYKVLGTENVA